MNLSHSLVSSRLSTVYGQFTVKAFESGIEEMPHLLLSNIDMKDAEHVFNVRIHSECMTGDVFGSTRCDCGEQLASSMKYIEDHGGVVIYLRQEGRGIGLVNKLRAYNLQDQGLDTIQANHALGFKTDDRNYKVAVEMLRSLGIRRINLLTNNPDKIDVFNDTEIVIVERIPLMIAARPENKNYLQTKKEVMGHLLHQI